MSHENMSSQELDMAVPSNLNLIHDYYRENMKNIVKLDSLRSSNETISSINSTHFEKRMENKIDDDSSTASNSDVEDDNIPTTNSKFANKIVKVSGDHSLNPPLPSDGNSTAVISHISNDTLDNKVPNINSVAISNSSNVQFGNNTFYNAPVTIVIKDESKLLNGTINKSFEGSHDDVNADPSQNEKKEIDKPVTQNDSKHITIKRFVLSPKTVLLATITIVCTLLVIISLLIVIFIHGDDDASDLKIITREEWNATPSKDVLGKLNLPVNRIIIAHTVTHPCYNKEDCIKGVQLIQRMHTGLNFSFSDIGYNFIVGGDGNIYEGRGWDYQGAHTSGYNLGSIGVAFIGNFINTVPNDVQIAAGLRLFSYGKRIHKLTSDYNIFAALQLRSTESPGKAFYEIIKTWDHWSDL